MATKIQWTDDTWNIVTGCTRVSEGCRNCYAEKLTATRLAKQPKYQGLAIYGDSGPRWTGEVRLHPDVLDAPLRMRKGKKIFVCDMSDLFHKDVPFEFIDKVFAVMALCQQHTFQVLTKRPQRMAEYFQSMHGGGAWNRTRAIDYQQNRFVGTSGRAQAWPLPNVWLGTSVENQAAADERIPHLLRCPARVRFLSVEPLLEAIDFGWMFKVVICTSCGKAHLPGCCTACDSRISKRGIHWVIVGGESGPGARPCDIAWILNIVAQCKDAGVPCFVKQLGAYARLRAHHSGTPPESDVLCRLPLKDSKGGDLSEWPKDLRVREFPK